jgi:hypothetical protein
MENLHYYVDALKSIPSSDPHFHFCQKAHRIFAKVEQMLSSDAITDILSQKGHPRIESALDPAAGGLIENDPVSWMTAIDQEWMEFGGSLSLPIELQDDGFMNI